MPQYPDCWETCGACGSGDVYIAEVLVKPGDVLRFDDNVISLDTGKTTLEIPTPHAGTVVEVFVKDGDEVAEGQLILTIDAE